MKHTNFTFQDMIAFADHVKETDPVRLQFIEGQGGVAIKGEMSTEELLIEWYKRKLINNKDK